MSVPIMYLYFMLQLISLRNTDRFIFWTKRNWNGKCIIINIIIIMWYYKKHLGFRILNLCKIVYVHQNHCIYVKLAHYKRYNNDGKSKSGLALFFSTLLYFYRFWLYILWLLWLIKDVNIFTLFFLICFESVSFPRTCSYLW